MDGAITYQQAVQDYFHFVAEPGQTFISYREWRDLLKIETIPSPRVKALIKATGYPGSTDLLDIIGWINDNIEWLRKKIVGIPDKISDVVDGIIRDLADWIGKVFQVVGNAVATLTAAVYRFGQQFSTILSRITTWISGIYKAIEQVISNVVNKVGDWIEDAIYAVKNWLDAVIRNVVSGFEATLEAVRSAVDSIAANVLSGIEALAGAIVDAFDASIRWVKDTIAAIAERLNDAIEASRDWIVGVYESIKTTATAIMDGIKEGFETGLDAVISFLADLWERIKEFVDDLFSLDLESLSAVFVKIFQAQQAAFTVMQKAVPG